MKLSKSDIYRLFIYQIAVVTYYVPYLSTKWIFTG
jgi:hypothetical protein